MPNDFKMKKEDCQSIFMLRSRVTGVKMNQRNRYENHECEVCGKFNESQEHVLNCKEIKVKYLNMKEYLMELSWNK